jgi:hypothetical protein
LVDTVFNGIIGSVKVVPPLHLNPKELRRDADGIEYEMPEIENALECAELGDGHSWSKGRTKSVLTFNRYVDLYGDPNLPEVEGMYKVDLDDEPKAPERIAPSP